MALRWKFSHCKQFDRSRSGDGLRNESKHTINTRIYVEKPLLLEQRKKTTGKLGFHYVWRIGYKYFSGG